MSESKVIRLLLSASGVCTLLLSSRKVPRSATLRPRAASSCSCSSLSRSSRFLDRRFLGRSLLILLCSLPPPALVFGLSIVSLDLRTPLRLSLPDREDESRLFRPRLSEMICVSPFDLGVRDSPSRSSIANLGGVEELASTPDC
jgi:hypothetical protein